MNGFKTAEFELLDLEISKSQRYQSAWKALAYKALAVTVLAETLIVSAGHGDEVAFQQGPALAVLAATTYGTAHAIQKRRNEVMESTTNAPLAEIITVTQPVTLANVFPIRMDVASELPIIQTQAV